mmetsp:Transcript_46328/g.98247  ORF Transcript_46328/g.98247 Transcript_46328/m.98247 type:complete len:112 (-) Transcript_46328:618-953(-)
MQGDWKVDFMLLVDQQLMKLFYFGGTYVYSSATTPSVQHALLHLSLMVAWTPREKGNTAQSGAILDRFLAAVFKLSPSPKSMLSPMSVANLCRFIPYNCAKSTSLCLLSRK